MAEKRQISTTTLQQEAVRLITDQRYGVAETARNLGVNVHRLRRWKQAYTTNAASTFPGTGRLMPEQEILCPLREDNTRRKMERDVVKKSHALL